MNNEWPNLLAVHNPPLEPTPTSRTTGANLCDLSGLGLLSARGPDAERFLQSQLTNDVQMVSPSRAQLSGYCNPKGRLLATLLLIRGDDGYWLQLPRSLSNRLLERLRLYVLRAKVELDAAHSERPRAGFWGSAAEEHLRQQLRQAPPAAAYDVAHVKELTIVRLPGVVPRFELLGTPWAMESVWQALAAVSDLRVGADWAALDIAAGIAEVRPETSELFVPQFVNFELVDGVSFTKGCYPGQEVVARMHYLGKPKRRLFRAFVCTEDIPAPATHLYDARAQSAQSVGQVVLAHPSTDEEVELLAVVQVTNRQAGDVRLGRPDGVSLTFGELPYALQARSQE